MKLQTKEDIVQREKRLSAYDGPDKMVSCYDIKEALAFQPDQWCLKSGIDGIDNSLGGFYGGEVTVISGKTGQGKTLISQTMTNHFFLTGNNCAWFSYEVMAKLFIGQFGNPLPDFYMPKQLKSSSVAWVKERIQEAKLKYDIKAVFVDHLHYLVNMNDHHNLSAAIGRAMREIVIMAHEFDIHFFLMAHMMKTTDEPSLGSVRDSGMIEQECDNVFYMWRDEKNPRIGNLKIAKNRRNGVFNQKIYLIKENNFFREAQGCEI